MAEISKKERGTIDRGLGGIVKFASPRRGGPQGVVIHGQKAWELEEDVPIVGKVQKDAKGITEQAAKGPQHTPISPRSVQPGPVSPPPQVQADVSFQQRDTVRGLDGQKRGISEESRARDRAATSENKVAARRAVDQWKQEALGAAGIHASSPPPLLPARAGEGGGSQPDSDATSPFLNAVDFALSLNAAANAAIEAVAHGVTDAALNIGGSASVELGLSTEDEYEETMLKFRLAGMSYNQTLVELGGKALDIYVESKEPGPEYPYRGPTTVYLDGKLGTLATKLLRRASRIGQEAHRQILKYKYPKWVPEVTLELAPGVIVRKDALRLTNKGAEVLIIKPDTPTGKILADRRAQLVKDAGYSPKVELYDPLNPDFRPGSAKYIGPAQ